MKVAVTGASGLIGTALVPALQQAGHQVVRLVRRPTRSADELSWDPAQRRLDPAALADVDAVIHLAGVGIGDRRWTAARKAAILDSRVDGTTTIATAMAAAQPRPRVLLSASAIGWYGDGGDSPKTEQDPAGSGFAADVVRRWEAATAPAEDAGIRVVHLRTGLVCASKGGLLARVLPLVKLGVGGKLASGKQYWSWVSLPDEVAAIIFLLDGDIHGPVNITGPEPVTNAEFTRIAGKVFHRPTFAAVPAVALKVVLGSEMAQNIALTGQRVLPTVLLENGFVFTHPTAESALRWVASAP